MQKKELLGIRKDIKKRKPKFIAQDSHKRKKLKQTWKRPTGVHSKVRHKMRGYKSMVDTGYKSPKAVSGLHPSGLKEVLVHSLNDIEKINVKEEGIVIGKGVGTKKKVEIVKKAKEKGIKILNIKDTDMFLKNIQENLAKKKADKSKKESDKEKKKKEAEKKAEEKEKEEKLEEKMSEEEKKEQEKKEKDKVLTKG